MKNKTLKGFFLLVFSCLFLVGCSGQAKKEFGDTIVEPTAEIGESFRIDTAYNKETNEVSDKNTITINSGEIIEDEGQKVLIVNYSWANSIGGSAIFQNVTLTAKQDNINLQPTLDHVDNTKLLVTNIEPGEVSEGIEQGFILNSDNPVTLSIMGIDTFWTENSKPLHAYPVTVEMDLSSL